ncbi:outer membrane protein assembly factor BamB [Kitasatospora phosalacinea]|uniref:Outer membrane protein assembly factor BamB n=1 Tax=Kitasatospora phosalacinea TaxID=2065 RepID=A0A9W6Q425_9ACTN|nr:PQQ-binding-like beta-propeller repeat protein [Kitasatospora phosalacinea]GLW67812.1 outer membrane protein assembly factor BamB [Kitasatospora phosalacinea]
MAGSRTMLQGGPTRNGVYPEGALPPDFRPWQFRTGRHRDLQSPSVCDGTVYVCSQDGVCYALSAVTGALRWSTTIGGRMDFAPPVVSDGVVCVTDDDGGLYALDAEDGRERWRQRHRGRVRLVADDGVLYGVDSAWMYHRGANPASLFAVDLASGETLWWTSVLDRSSTHPALADGRIFRTSDVGDLTAFDAATGDLLWRVKCDSTWVDMANTPCVAGGVVYAAVQSTLFAHAAEDGEVLWARAYDGLIRESVSVLGDTVYFGTRRSRRTGCYAVDAADGEVRWHSAHPGDASAVALSGTSGWTVSGRGMNYLCAVDLATGARRWKRYLGPRGGTVPVLWNGIAVVSTHVGRVSAVDARTGRMPSRLAAFTRATGGR